MISDSVRFIQMEKRKMLPAIPKSKFFVAIGLVLALASGQVIAQQEGQGDQSPQAVADVEVNEAASLDELLELVRQRRVVESREHSAREREFANNRDRQQQMLEDAEAEKRSEERRAERLDAQFNANEDRIDVLAQTFDERLGRLKELFGVLQQVAGDTRGLFEGSIISAEFEQDRGEWLSEFAAKMGTSSQLATIEEMERLWFELQREMTKTGEVNRFDGIVSLLNGENKAVEVVRVGAFNLVAEGEYLNYVPGVGITELARQPPGRYASTVEDLEDAGTGDVVEFAVDPTRGSLLSLLIQAATVGERVGSVFGGITDGDCYLPFCDGQGGYVGSIIILGGILGVLLAIERFITLYLIGRKVRAQRESDEATDDNPLGRIMKVYEANKSTDVETLELKLSEAILTETPAITRNITLIQVISVVAPLAGLLGTVIGMILTFQAITLFGTGDPKTMAGGISTALMTTVLGLCVAIPTVLLHALVNGQSKSLIHLIDEQSAGIVADHAERTGEALG